MKYAGITGMITAIALCCATFAATEDIRDLAAQLPAESIQDADAVFAQCIEKGPKGIAKLCDMLSAEQALQARYALSGLAKYVSTGARGDARAVVAEGLLTGLKKAKDDEAKAFLIRCLELAGKDESVPALEGSLDDARLCDPAAQALVEIGSEAAAGALRRALPKADDARRVIIIKALGDLRCAPVADAIRMYAASGDDNTRSCALYALANIGDPASGDLLAEDAEADSFYARSKATSLYLLYARRVAEAGQQATAAAICRALYEARAAEPGAQVEALGVLVDIAGPGALDDLLAAMDNPSKEVRCGALMFADAIPGEEATEAWVMRVGGAQVDVRAEIISMLGRRGDPTAVPVVVRCLGAEDLPVRMAAIDAIVRINDTDAPGPLLAALQHAGDEAVAATKAALLRIGGPGIMPAIAAGLATTPPAGRVALLDVLATRSAKGQAEAVFEQTQDTDESVRIAATKALARLATPDDLERLIALVTAAQTEAEREAAQNTVVAVAKHIEDPAQCADVILAALQGRSPAERTVLLPMLAGVGGATALEAVVGDTRSNDAAVRDVAIRTLAEWPELDAMPHLLGLARDVEDLKMHVLALRGYTRLVGAAKLSEPEKVMRYQEGLDVARRVDEKRLILGGLAALRITKALEAVAACLDEEALRGEAASAAAQIACPRDEKDKGLVGPEVAAALKRILEVVDDADLRKPIAGHLASMPVPDGFNLALGKPVTASVEHQGDHVLAKAVDGNLDADAAWFGASCPCWLEVDLGEPVPIDKAQVVFYYDGERYYQYKLESSVDGETWNVVADMSQYALPATRDGVIHRFESVEARYVRVHVLKNSVNEAAHVVEVKVWAEGTGPERPPDPKPLEEGFVSLFNGQDLTGWKGDTQGYAVEEGMIVCKPGGDLYTNEQYSDFIFRFEFKLTPGANNGLGIRCPFPAHAAYDGMELQILDNTAQKYFSLQPYQYHGSIYGVVPAKRGFLRPVGEWNYQEVIAQGRRITVNLNGETIVDVNLDEASKDGTMDHKDHPGLKRNEGHICFCGHGDVLWFRNLRVKELE